MRSKFGCPAPRQDPAHLSRVGKTKDVAIRVIFFDERGRAPAVYRVGKTTGARASVDTPGYPHPSPTGPTGDDRGNQLLSSLAARAMLAKCGAATSLDGHGKHVKLTVGGYLARPSVWLTWTSAGLSPVGALFFWATA